MSQPDDKYMHVYVYFKIICLTWYIKSHSYVHLYFHI